MKYISVIFVIILTVVSCKKEAVQPEKNTCGAESPVNDLSWLKQEIATREADTRDFNKYFYIQQGVYEGQTVFVYNNCCPYCDTILLVFNCSGVKIEQVNIQNITNLKVIWSPANFDCQL